MGDIMRLATNAASLLGVDGSLSFQSHLEKSIPGFGKLQTFFKTWLKLDITTLFIVVSLLGTASSGFSSLQGAASKVYWWILKFLTASISVAGNDCLNREVLNWLGANVLAQQGSRILNAHSETIKNDAWRYRHVQERNDYRFEKRVPVQYLPTFGVTWFFYKRNLFMVRRILTAHSNRNRASSSRMPDEYAGAPEGTEPLVIMCLGRSVEPVKNFIQDCREFADKQRAAYITVRAHKSNHFDNDSWDITILRPMRSLETIHFDERVKVELVADIKNYLEPATSQFYTQRGIPYRRGYLLHGPPGTGKTSLSLALAGYFGLELYLLHIPSLRDDKQLETLFTSLPPRCIVLLEDIDAAGVKRRRAAEILYTQGPDEGSDSDSEEEEAKPPQYRNCRVSLSGLLNVLDGVASQEGRIVCMTSNFVDRLDAALTRPGRIDKKIFLGYISKQSTQLMFLRMYAPNKDEAVPTAGQRVSTSSLVDLERMAVKFAESIPEATFTPAQLQGYLLNYREDAKQAVEHASSWVSKEVELMEETKTRAKKAAELRRKRRREIKARTLVRRLQRKHSVDSDLSSPEGPADKKNGIEEKASKDATESLAEKAGEDGAKDGEKDGLTQSTKDKKHLNGEVTNGHLTASSDAEKGEVKAA